eukprot:gene54525-biopygen38799
MTIAQQTGTEIAASINNGTLKASAVVDVALARIEKHDGKLGSFTDVVAERARKTADTIDRRLAAGENIGPLAGVPFAVKNLFDVAGLPTRAGSRINRERKPASADAMLIQRLEA